MRYKRRKKTNALETHVLLYLYNDLTEGAWRDGSGNAINSEQEL